MAATEATTKKARLTGNSEPLEDYSTGNTLPIPPSKASVRKLQGVRHCTLDQLHIVSHFLLALVVLTYLF